MENTTEDKARFLAQYYGQKVLFHINSRPELIEFEQVIAMCESVEYYCALLTSLSDITEEHAIEALMLSLCRTAEEFDGKPHDAVSYYKFNGSSDLTSIEADFLRKNSYAVPFDGISVEELIELGWVKIRKS